MNRRSDEDRSNLAVEPEPARAITAPANPKDAEEVSNLPPRGGRTTAGSSTNRGSNALEQGLRVFVKVLIPLVVIAAGVLGAVELFLTGPKAQQRPPQVLATLVETRALTRSAEPVVVHALGTVVAAQEVVIQPQVSGTIVELHPDFVPGGLIREGEVLLTLDPAEYEVAVDQAEAALARSRAQLQSALWEIERVRGLEASGASNKKEMDNALTAQAVAEADVLAGEAALERAQLDLARTTIRAPFTGVITSEAVDLGGQVTMQSQLATLVGTDAYWVQASVPVDRLAWITIPTAQGEHGSSVQICQRLGARKACAWTGQVIRLLGDLEPQGRMARLLVAIPDPLRLSAKGESETDTGTPLLIGSYVEVKLEGRTLPDVVVLAREELREDDTVWLMDKTGKLEIRPVEVAHRGQTRVLISAGLSEEDRLVTSDLPAPVAGMPLRTGSSTEPTSAGGSAGDIRTSSTAANPTAAPPAGGQP